MDEVVRQLAQNEWEASQQKRKAEAAWRSAWWETTFALADIGHATEGYDAAEAELGQSRAYLQQRRRVGLAVEPSCRREAHGLPPSYSIEWVREGRSRIDGAAISAILAAEEDHVSTRRFVEQVARPAVRRTPVAPPRQPEEELVPVTPPVSSWEPPVPPRPDARPAVTPAFQPVVESPAEAALTAALMKVDGIFEAMTRLEQLIPRLDDKTRPTFRGRLLELDVRLAVMIETLNPESGFTFTESDAKQLLEG